MDLLMTSIPCTATGKEYKKQSIEAKYFITSIDQKFTSKYQIANVLKR